MSELTPSSPPRASKLSRFIPKVKRRTLIKLTVGLGLFLFLLPMALRLAINWAAQRWVSPELSLSRLGLNPITGKARVGVRHSNAFGIKDYQVEWDWVPLLRRTLRIREVRLDGLTLAVERFADGTIQIQDIRYRPSEESLVAQQEPGQARKPLTLQVGPVELKNIKLALIDHVSKLTVHVTLDRFLLTPHPAQKQPYAAFTVGSELERILEFTGQAQLENLRVSIDPPAKGTAAPANLIQGVEVQIQGACDVRDFYTRLVPSETGGLKDWAVRLGTFTTLQPTRFEIASNQFRSPLKMVFDPVSLKLAGVDSTQPDQETALTLSAQPADGAAIKLQFQGYPSQKPLSLQQSLDIKNFPLSAASPLAERFLQYQLTSGRVDKEVQLRVRRGLLESDTQLTIKRLKLTRLKAGTEDPLGSSLGLPLGTAVALLQDGEGNIRLDIPVKADLNAPGMAPEVLVQKAVIQGIQAGMKTALTHAFPNLFKLGGSGFGLAIEPVVFAPGVGLLNETTGAALDRVGELMSKRPALVLQLNGIANAADVYARRKMPAPEKAPLTVTEITDTEKNAVFAVATGRVEACRTYLKTKFNIPAERLAAGAPDYAVDVSSPMVVLSF